MISILRNQFVESYKTFQKISIFSKEKYDGGIAIFW